jgi:hypothetical protein
MSRDSRNASAPRRHRAAPSRIVCSAAIVRRQSDIQRSVDNGYCAERAMIRDYRGENSNLFAYRIAS